MKNRYLLICAVIVLVTLAVTLALYAQLPANIPIHWNARGEVDAYGPRHYVFGYTVLMVVFMLVWMLLPSSSPKRFSVDRFNATYWQICAIMVALFGYLECVLVWGAYSPTMPRTRAMCAGLAIFTGLLGNVMGKVRRNFWIGIRTPWTLADEHVWYSTHRFAAKTMVGAALLSIAALPAGLPVLACLALLMAGVLVPVVYSLLVYKRLEKGGRLDA
jgi:uncharacterized membrane protein